jgi:hypothetical protein
MNVADPVRTKIYRRIRTHKTDWVFGAFDFVDLGSRRAIDTALSRLNRAGSIGRILPGLYYVPRQHPIIGRTSPDTIQVVKALARKHALRVQPTGAAAANMLGLSDQVPAKVEFLIDGRTRRYHIGKLRITLRRASARTMATAGRISGLIIQSLRYIGKAHVDKTTVERLKHRLPPRYKQQLLKDLVYAPAWIANIMRHLGGNPGYQNLAVRDAERAESFL